MGQFGNGQRLVRCGWRVACGLVYDLPSEGVQIRDLLRERSGIMRSYTVLIAGAVLVTAILVAVLLPHHCLHLLGPCLQGGPCHKVICSGLGDVPRLGIALGGLAAATVLFVWHRAPS